MRRLNHPVYRGRTLQILADVALCALAFLLGMVGLAMGVMTNPLFDDGVQTFLWLYAGAIVAIGHRVTDPSPVLASPLRPALAT